MSGGRSLALVLVLAGLLAPSAAAADIAGSSDLTLDLGGAIRVPGHVSSDLTALPSPTIDLGPLPEGADVTAYSASSGSDQLFSVGHTLSLPGGVTAGPRDVVLWDGASYSLALDGAAAGIPDGAAIDAFAFDADTGDVWISFDTTVDLGGSVLRDADVADGNSFALVFDATAAGVPEGTDVDAVGMAPGPGGVEILLSFDVSGAIGGVDFSDEDVLRYDPAGGGFSLELDSGAVDSDWEAADLDALHPVPEPGFLIGLAAGVAGLSLLARRARPMPRRRPMLRRRAIFPFLSALLALCGLAAAPARAVDGVIEINQARANAGTASGDAPGFPVTVSAPGSYRLTSNLEVDDLNTTAIEVTADDVSIDLNGFVIQNRTPCRPDCGAPGTGVGVDASGQENTAVSNGTIIGMGSAAILSGADSQVSRVRAIGNGGAGIVVGDRGSVRECTVDGAGGVGIQTGSSGGVFDSSVASTTDEGILMGGGSTVSGSRIQNAGDDGIEITGKRASVIGNVILQSGGIGIFMKDGVVAQNVISQSAFTAIYMFGGSGGGVIQGNQLSENTSGADVASTPGTVLRGNAIRSNTALAINGSGDDGYEGNVLSGNAGAPQVSGAVEIGSNVCDGNTTCP